MTFMKFQDHESIPASVQEMILSQADAMFITEIDIVDINDWLAEHHEAFKILAGVYA